MDKCTYECDALNERLRATERLVHDIKPTSYTTISSRLVAVELVKHSLTLALEELEEILTDIIVEQEVEILNA